MVTFEESFFHNNKVQQYGILYQVNLQDRSETWRGKADDMSYVQVTLWIVITLTKFRSKMGILAFWSWQGN